jgi:hypothetical protein
LLKPFDVEDCTRRFVEKRGIDDLVKFHTDANKLFITLHPSAEPCYVEIDRQFTTFAAKTSNAGPGYHALITELLEVLSAELALEWMFDGDNYQDETGYWEARNFRALQTRMSVWLQELTNVIVRPGAEEATFNVNMPEDYGGVEIDAAVITPMGPFDKSFFINAARDDKRLEKASKQFFPWWEREIDASFWYTVGLTMMWIEVPWRPPADDVLFGNSRTD